MSCNTRCSVENMGSLECQALCNTTPRCAWCDNQMIEFCKLNVNNPLCGCLNPLYGDPNLGLGYCFSSQCTSGYNSYMTTYMKNNIANQNCSQFCKNIIYVDPTSQAYIKNTTQYINGCGNSNYNVPFKFSKPQLILIGILAVIFCIFLISILFKKH